MKILIPLPTYGFDPTEVAIPWKIFSQHGIEGLFATPDGERASADRLMLTGDRLGVWKPLLKARTDALDAHEALLKDASFCNPMEYSATEEAGIDALFLPGGHDKGVKEYLESGLIQTLVVDFFAARKPIAAICHGVVVAARSINPLSRKSVIHNYKTTALLRSQEMAAYNMTRLWMGDYYLTYPGATVQDEVTTALSDSRNFESGPMPLLRDSHQHLERGFVVTDRNYLSARWPGDVYSLSLALVAMMKSRSTPA